VCTQLVVVVVRFEVEGKKIFVQEFYHTQHSTVPGRVKGVIVSLVRVKKDVCGALVLQNQRMRTLLHAIRVVGSTLENDLNLRF
jgi:hypothetical protein